MTLNVLVVDDDSNVRETLCERIRDMGHQCREAENVTGALFLAETEKFDLILTDYKMDDFDGIYFVRELRKKNSDSLVAMMTAYASIDRAVAAIKEGAFDFVSKPFNSNQLRQLLGKAQKMVEGKAGMGKLGPPEEGDYFGALPSESMRKLKVFIDKVARTDATVLLTGDSGTGKSRLAKDLHNRSRVKDGPFIEVHCTTLPSELIESELFGHEKGSFTGATKNKKGKIQEAEKGTLFLDEIGELPPSGQAKLLRFLQEKQIDPVGSNKSYFVDTRIVAATNKNLLEMVRQGLFREDLYYRLNMFECLVSPLRERMEDVPALINKFIAEMEKNSQGKRFHLSEDLKRKFLAYDWPGNVRELKNTIERLCYLSEDGELRESDLPERYFGNEFGAKKISPAAGPQLAGAEASGDGQASSAEDNGPAPDGDARRQTQPFDTEEAGLAREQERYFQEQNKNALMSLEQVEKKHIKKVLEQVKNLDKASEILGITTVTLWRKRKQYGIS